MEKIKIKCPAKKANIEIYIDEVEVSSWREIYDNPQYTATLKVRLKLNKKQLDKYLRKRIKVKDLEYLINNRQD